MKDNSDISMQERTLGRFRRPHVLLVALLALTIVITASVGVTLAYLITETPSIVNTFVDGTEDVKGNLEVHTTVNHPYGSSYSIPDSITFPITVDLGEENAGHDFGRFHANDSGVISLRLKSRESLTISDIPYGTSISVTENLAGREGFTAPKLTQNVKIDSDKTKKITFENTYTPAPAKMVTVTGKKIFTGHRLAEGDTFTYRVDRKKNDSDDTWSEIGTTTVKVRYMKDSSGGWVVNPSSMTFNLADIMNNAPIDTIGTYSFRIVEVDSKLKTTPKKALAYDEDQSKNVTEDGKPMASFTVEVADDDMDGSLHMKKVTTSTPSNTEVLDTTGTGADPNSVYITFETHYVVSDEALATFNITLTLDDKSGQEKMPEGTEFALYDAAGNKTLSTVKTTASGRADIEMPYRPQDIGKTFTYVLKQTHAGETVNAMNYDDTQYVIHVDVARDEDGDAKAYVYDVLDDDVESASDSTGQDAASGDAATSSSAAESTSASQASSSSSDTEASSDASSESSSSSGVSSESETSSSSSSPNATSTDDEDPMIDPKNDIKWMGRNGMQFVGTAYAEEMYVGETTPSTSSSALSDENSDSASSSSDVASSSASIEQATSSSASSSDESSKDDAEKGAGSRNRKLVKRSEATDTYDAVFSNVYNPEEATVTLTGTIELSDRASTTRGAAKRNLGSFQLNLYRTNASFDIQGLKPEQDVTSANEQGEFSFKPLTFARVGTYYFVISEDSATSSRTSGLATQDTDNVQYDDTKYHVTIQVSDGNNGTLVAQTIVTDEQGKESDVKFVNVSTEGVDDGESTSSSASSTSSASSSASAAESSSSSTESSSSVSSVVATESVSTTSSATQQDDSSSASEESSSSSSTNSSSSSSVSSDEDEHEAEQSDSNESPNRFGFNVKTGDPISLFVNFVILVLGIAALIVLIPADLWLIRRSLGKRS